MIDRDEVPIHSWNNNGTSINPPFSSVTFLDQRLLGDMNGDGDANGEIISPYPSPAPPPPVLTGLDENEDDLVTTTRFFLLLLFLLWNDEERDMLLFLLWLS